MPANMNNRRRGPVGNLDGHVRSDKMKTFWRTQILFALLVVASAIDISLSFLYRELPRAHLPPSRSRVTYTCEGIPAGECCKAHAQIIATLRHMGSSTSVAGTLLADQLVAGWNPSMSNPTSFECAGRPIARHFGPGIWVHSIPSATDARFDADFNELIYAASWVDLRTRFPPGSLETRYLQWQGVRGLVWGQNTWSAASDGIPFPKRNIGLRLNAWAPRGIAYIQPPSRWRYPNVYFINGTNYTGSGDGVYTSRDGRTLDFNA